MSTLSVYLAGPISGLSYDECCGWRDEVAAALDSVPGFRALDPMRHKQHLEDRESISTYEDHPLSSPEFILARDLLDIDRCDVVLVNLRDAKKVSVGTAVEIGYAKAKGKRIILVIEGDGTNPHHHPFVLGCADIVVESLDEAVRLLEAMA